MSNMLRTSDKRVLEIVAEGKKRIQSGRENQQQIADQKRIKENWKELRRVGFGQKEARPPVILNYEEGQMLYDVMPDDSWKGQRCFIIGGGESLKGFDFSQLKGELVIGVNRAYEKIDCTIMFSMDRTLYDWITGGKLGKEAKEKFENFKGFRVWLDTVGYDYPKGIFILNKSKNNKTTYSMKDGIGGGTNSGFGALSLAACLGAKQIYLLGFDLKEKADGKQSWWHDGYPEIQGSKVYKAFRNDFARVAPELKAKKIEVINLNPDSELKCFEFGKLEDIKPIMRPVIVSYYTMGTGYETQVENLKDSLRRFNLDNDVLGVPDQGTWRKNVYYKAGFLKRMMTKHAGRPIVFVDADAVFRMNPVLFNDYDCDFACHFFNGKELLSGSLYIGNTKGGRMMISEWIKKNKENPTVHMPQRNLAVVYEEQKDNIKSKVLPVEYCMIFDSSARHIVKPIIEHFQLSRLYKNFDTTSVMVRRGYRMKESLIEIEKFCEDKDICLLGNAASILKEKKDIDSFDIVCRMNRGTPRGKEEFIGSRTDILFHSTHMSAENINKVAYTAPKFVVWMTVCHRLASTWAMSNAYQNPSKDWNYLYSKLGINPTTGMMSLYFLLNHTNFKSLTIYGFDFFKTRSWYNKTIDSGQKHSGEKEEVLFMDMIKDNPKVKFI